MALKLYPETSVQDIANAIREKNGETTTYSIGEMGTAIRNIPSGGVQPQLFTPTIAVKGNTLVIAPSESNGDFNVGASYEIFSNATSLSTISDTSIDLTTLVSKTGQYIIKVVEKQDKFRDSEDSNEETWNYTSNALTLTNIGSEAGNVYIAITGVLSNPVNIYYSINGGEWTSWINDTSGTSNAISVGVNDAISIWNDSTKLSESDTQYVSIVANNGGSFKLTKTPNSMINTGSMYSYCYRGLFENSTTITDASEFSLPSGTPQTYCYKSMFAGCTALVTAPSVALTKVAEGCCSNMFNGCTSLTSCTSFPTINMSTSYCYEKMFYNCTSLTKPFFSPTAVTMKTKDWYQMFYGCSSLKVSGSKLSGYQVFIMLPDSTGTDGTGEMFKGCQISDVTTWKDTGTPPGGTIVWCYKS